MQTLTDMSFKFKYVKNATAQGFRNKSANATLHALTLNESHIPYEMILDTTSRDNRVVIQFSPHGHIDEAIRKEFTQSNILVLEIYQKKAIDLEKFIDRHASAKIAKRRQHLLESSGEGYLFRAFECPHCFATIDLTDYEKSTTIFCRYCESIISQSQNIVANGDEYRHCDECNMFDRVQGHTEFYFYFLLIVYGFRSKRRHLCDACALKISNKALLINLPFILGIFPALYMRIKASRGKDSSLNEMSQANKMALAGNYQEADSLFESMLMNFPNHPGILFNQSMAHFNGNDSHNGINFLAKSLKISSNYLPSLRYMHQLNQVKQAQSPR